MNNMAKANKYSHFFQFFPFHKEIFTCPLPFASFALSQTFSVHSGKLQKIHVCYICCCTPSCSIQMGLDTEIEIYSYVVCTKKRLYPFLREFFL